jgi:hypothetical protein
MTTESIVDINHSLEILAKLSCLPQINRYEYYLSRGENEKAQKIIEETIKSILSSRSFIEDFYTKIHMYLNEIRGIDSSKLRDYVSNLKKTIYEAMYTLNNMPWHVGGCHVIKGHTLSLLYTVSNTLNHLERIGFMSGYVNELIQYLEMLKNHLEDLQKLLSSISPRSS